jgi:hypothetical protein
VEVLVEVGLVVAAVVADLAEVDSAVGGGAVPERNGRETDNAEMALILGIARIADGKGSTAKPRSVWTIQP